MAQLSDASVVLKPDQIITGKGVSLRPQATVIVEPVVTCFGPARLNPKLEIQLFVACPEEYHVLTGWPLISNQPTGEDLKKICGLPSLPGPIFMTIRDRIRTFVGGVSLSFSREGQRINIVLRNEAEEFIAQTSRPAEQDSQLFMFE
jgi:hypothetical protein